MASPFQAPGHPFVIAPLKYMFPGFPEERRICGFSLHFPMDEVSTIKVEMQLNEADMGELVRLVKEYRLIIEDEICQTCGGTGRIETTNITNERFRTYKPCPDCAEEKTGIPPVGSPYPL